jgi:hypothetical protein
MPVERRGQVTDVGSEPTGKPGSPLVRTLPGLCRVNFVRKGPRRIIRHTFFTAGVVAFAAFGASPASATPVATPIPSSLNCPIVGGSACASSPGSYGTLTFTNAGANTVECHMRS